MKQGLTIITKGVVYMMGIAVIAVCAILLPELAREEAVSNPNAGPAYPFLIGAWVLATPIFLALHQALKLLSYIEVGDAFSNQSVKALQNIKNCAIVFSALIAAGATTVIILARMTDPSEDVTAIVAMGLIFTFVSIVVATFAAVMQRLLQEAIDIKSENDLIV